MSGSTSDAATPDGPVLIVSERADFDPNTLPEAVERFEYCPDVYLAMARLAAAPRGRYSCVVVDDADLGEHEARFANLAQRFFPDLAVRCLSARDESPSAAPSPRRFEHAAPERQPAIRPQRSEPFQSQLVNEPSLVEYRSTTWETSTTIVTPRLREVPPSPPSEPSVHAVVREKMRASLAERGAGQPVVRTPPGGRRLPPLDKSDEARAVLSREELEALLRPGPQDESKA